MSTILQDAAIKAATNVATELLTSLAKGTIERFKEAWAEAQREEEEHPAVAVPEMDNARLDEVFANIFDSHQAFSATLPEVDYATWAADCANDFLCALQSGRDNRVCEWCSPTLFDHPARKQVLLETLSSARPCGWMFRGTLDLVSTRERTKSYGADFDVEFKVDGGFETAALLLVFAQSGESLVVKDIYWAEPHDVSWR